MVGIRQVDIEIYFFYLTKNNKLLMFNIFTIGQKEFKHMPLMNNRILHKDFKIFLYTISPYQVIGHHNLWTN